MKKIRPNPEENLINASSISCLPDTLTESPDSIFVSGDFQVELITSNPDSIVVNITNLLTGEVTVVEIPRFG